MIELCDSKNYKKVKQAYQSIKAADYNLKNQASVDRQRYEAAEAKRQFKSKYSKKGKTLQELHPIDLRSDVNQKLTKALKNTLKAKRELKQEEREH